MTARADALDSTLAAVRACRQCAAALPLGPRPVLLVRTTARLLIVGQAPGRDVLPWLHRRVGEIVPSGEVELRRALGDTVL